MDQKQVTATPQLSESDVKAIEQYNRHESKAVFDLVPALIRDWRALKAERDEAVKARDLYVSLKRGQQERADELYGRGLELLAENAALREQLAGENQQRGLVVISALINFIDWLATQGVLVTNVPEPRASELRADLVKQFLAAHSEGENYFMQAEQIAEILGAPFLEAAANESVTNEATFLEADNNLLWINPVAGAVAHYKAGDAFLPYRLVREDGDDG